MLYPTRALRVDLHKGHQGFNPPGLRPEYPSNFKSAHGPQYKIGMNWHGINASRLMKFGTSAGMFGGVLGIFALFFFSDIPRVRIDIMEKMPVIGGYFHKETPPEDNPF